MGKYPYLVLPSICAIVLLLTSAPAIAGNVEIVRLPPLIFETVYCGDGNCVTSESCATCPADCGECEVPLGIRALALISLLLLVLFILIKRRGLLSKKKNLTW